MKKYLVIILLLVLFLTGCINKKHEIQYGLGNQDIVISYRERNGNTPDSIEYQVDLFNTKVIRYGYSNEDGFKSVDLNNEQYNEIIKYAFSDEFKNLDHELGKDEGTYESMTLYYDYKQFKVSGYDIDNETFIKLKNLLLNYE